MIELATCDEKLFWYYIRERHTIYLNREAGKPKPWTGDPILQQYKFVNVFRRLDRTTRWLIHNFLEPHKDDDPGLIAFNICWFRMFSRWETGAALGWQTRWDAERWYDTLRAMTTPVFTGAYIIHSEPGQSKLFSIIEVCRELEHLCLAGNALVTCAQEEGMQAVWRGLQHIRHVGEFMAYQMVLDMMYVPSLLADADDRMTWTCTGPGALRGLRLLNPETTKRTSLAEMLGLRLRSEYHLPEDFPVLDVHDIEFCLCELDKYCRVRFGEGRPRSSYPGLA